MTEKGLYIILLIIYNITKYLIFLLFFQSFELYTELSEKNNDKYGMCQGFFVISEIFKRAGDFEKSIGALNKCQELAKNHCFDIPLIFSAISLGQIETAKVSGKQE